ncbi:putative oxidoreductase protein [Liberibacter crescens BT-1]|uniref:Putative oxidoreductase protein n=1 Tax=Liberibacter crescens (strain BT-1) TaxID=1215343 RepID=L0EWW7_LIBCB|nr:nitroreductase family protein [Liberibacter crescens]AGA65360.1 putative oxidoreductase protein [Liberibacter crescens BT-1]AMC12298.1 nitroreductase [Liberibacter crescens]
MISINNRTSEHTIDSIFLNRWSPRAFNQEAISEKDLLTILDAAHWAPSSFNYQPWKFLYALRDTKEWDKLFSILSENNQIWVKNASALVIIFSETKNHSNEKIYSHSFDAGCSWGFLALQTIMLGYYAHAMTGINFQAAKSILGYSDFYRLEAAVAIGKHTNPEILPENLRKKEIPNDRKSLSEVCFKGNFPF